MKKLFRFGIASLALAMCFGAGALALKNMKMPQKVDASGEAWVGLDGTGIVGTYFNTANEALHAQASSMTSRGIKLLRDTTESGNIWLNTTNVIVDLNGHTLTIGASGSEVNRFIGIRDYTARGNIETNVTLTIMSSVSGGKINGYCADSIFYIDPSNATDEDGKQNSHTATVNINPGVQVKNFGTGRTILLHKSSTLNVRDGASVITTWAAQPGVINYGGSITNCGTIQGVNNAVILQPEEVNGVQTTPSISLSGANALATPRILSKRSGGVNLSNYSFSENNTSVNPVNVVFDSNVTLSDNLNIFSNIHWKYKNTFNNYISVSANGSTHHTLTWAQQKANETGYLRWVRNTYTVSYNINGGKSGTTSSQNASAESSVTLRNNYFTAQDYHSFKEWNTQPDGNGVSYQPGVSYQVNGNITFYAIWYQTDTNVYDEFRIEYLHINDYTEEKGWCMNSDEHHYYSTAKDYFENSMTKNQRVYFAGHYSDEWDRFRAWAAANGETIVLESGDYVIQSSNAGVSFIPVETNNAAILVVAISAMTTSIGFAVLILLKKRHSHK